MANEQTAPQDTDDDLLTDEERAAFAADEGEEIDGSASLTGEDTQDWIDNGWGKAREPDAKDDKAADAQEPDDDAAQTDADAGDDDGAAKPDPEPEPEPDTAQTQEDSPPQEPREELPPEPSAYDEQIKTLRQQDQELIDKYDDGDLTREQLREQRAELEGQIDKAIEDRAIARQRYQDDERQWQSACTTYLDANAGLKDGKVIAAFNDEVKYVTASPAFANKSFADQLKIAHQRLAASADSIGIEVPPPPGQKPPKAETKRDTGKTDPRGDDLRTPPTTLKNVPASDMNDAGDGKYSALERLINDDTVHPDEKEAALERLSDEERDQFASMNT